MLYEELKKFGFNIELDSIILEPVVPIVKNISLDTYCFKLWNSAYKANYNVYSVGKEFIPFDGNQLHCQAVGFLDHELSSAFIDNVYHNDELIGYVSKKGSHIDEYLAPNGSYRSDFIDFMIKICMRARFTGWIPSDICHNNVVSVNGTFSLIDYNSHLTKLDSMDYDFELKHGVLRDHIYPFIRGFAFSYIGA